MYNAQDSDSEGVLTVMTFQDSDSDDIEVTMVTTCESERHRSLRNLDVQDYQLIMSPHGWLNGAIIHSAQVLLQKINPLIEGFQAHLDCLFVGGGEILSREGTTQGDPLAMSWYALNTSIMIQNLRDHCPLVKQVWLADDSAGGGSIVQLYNWYRQLSKEGQKFGYLVNGQRPGLL